MLIIKERLKELLNWIIFLLTIPGYSPSHGQSHFFSENYTEPRNFLFYSSNFQDGNTDNLFSLGFDSYTFYKKGNFKLSLTVLENFLKDRRNQQVVPYILYLKGQLYYEQVCLTKNNLDFIHAAIKAYYGLVISKQCRSSQYIETTKSRLGFLYNLLAEKNVDVSRCYQAIGSDTAAEGRLNSVMRYFQRTPSISQAMYKVTLIYLKNDLRKEAFRATSSLGYSFPSSQLYANLYNVLLVLSND